MKSLAISCCAAAALALSCGDNQKGAPADASQDATDAPSFPAAPTLGTQIDRMARPAINTALTSAFLDTATVSGMKKDAYNAASDPATWRTTNVATGVSVVAEFAANLAVIDVLDQGDPAITGPKGCANQVLYNGGAGGPPAASSYVALAATLADDMLYVDTQKTSCTAYLSLEVELATGGTIVHTHCGGRSPTADVVDTSYSALAVGLGGFTVTPQGEFIPKYVDGAPAHPDVSESAFPYFGAPH